MNSTAVVRILDSATGNNSIPPKQSGGKFGMAWTEGRGEGIRPPWSPNASSLKLLNARRVSATLDECCSSSRGWNCSLWAFWSFSGNPLRFPEFRISVSAFGRLCERAQCCVQIAFLCPFPLSEVRKSVPWGMLHQCGSAMRDSFPPVVFCIHILFSNGIKFF